MVRDRSLEAGHTEFGERLSHAIERNRSLLKELIEELTREGTVAVDDLQRLPQGYRTKMLHVITHFLDGFFGIDTHFYNLEEDSHWVSEETLAKVEITAGGYWLLSIEAGW